MNIIERIKDNLGSLGRWSKQGHGYFMYPKLEGDLGVRMKFRGREVLNWSLNNYLGMASNPDLRRFDEQLVLKYGLANPMGSRLMTGQTSMHEKLEDAISSFVGTEDSYILNSYFQGTVSVIDCLCGRNDVLVYDPDVHSSIHDGIRLHPTNKRFTYLKNKFENLERQLANACECAKEQDGGVLLITEGILALTGELVPLDQIAGLRSKYDFTWIVCDAHGIGVLGEKGIGATEHFGVTDKVDVLIGNFEKTLGIFGGYVAGSETIINYLRYNMRSQTFSESLPLVYAGSALNRLKFIQDNPQLRKQLWVIVDALQKGLREAGCDIGSTQSPITPVFFSVDNMQEALHILMDIRENYHIFCVPIIYPYVQVGRIIIRLIPTAMHSLEDVEYTVEIFARVLEKKRNGKYKDDMPIG